MATLERLTELAMGLAGLVRLQAFDQTAAMAAGERVMVAQVAADVGLTFSRLARCVRLTIALEARIDRDQQRAAAERTAPIRLTPQPARPAVDPAPKADPAPDVEDDRADAPDPGLAAILAGRLGEGLEREQEMEEALDSPAADLVAEVCAALGVEMDGSLWSETAAAPAPAPTAQVEAKAHRTRRQALLASSAETPPRAGIDRPGARVPAQPPRSPGFLPYAARPCPAPPPHLHPQAP